MDKDLQQSLELQEAVNYYKSATDTVSKVLEYLISQTQTTLDVEIKEQLIARLETVIIIFEDIEAFLANRGQNRKTNLQRWIINASALINYIDRLPNNEHKLF
jgi:hypothetical protein